MNRELFQQPGRCIGSTEQDLAGELLSSVCISFSVTGSKDVRGGTGRAKMSGGSADAVVAWDGGGALAGDRVRRAPSQNMCGE